MLTATLLVALLSSPLTLHSRAPIYDNKLAYTAGRMEPVPLGVGEVMLAGSQANDWAQMPGYFFDGEWSRLAFRGAYGFADGWEVNLDWALIGRSGGFLDGFIEGFHAAFGVTQSRRNVYPNNQLRIATMDARGTLTWLDNNNAGVGTSNPVLGVKKRLTLPGGYPRVVADLAVKLPVGSFGNAFGTSGVELLFDLSLSQPFGDVFVVDMAMGLIASPGFNVVYGMQQSEVQKFLLLAAEWRVADHVTLVLQYMNQDGAAEKAAYAPLNTTTHEFALGCQWQPLGTEAWMLEAGLIENAVHDANTADFGFILGARWRP